MNIAVLYKLMRSRPIKDINQINAALEIMLCREHDENFNLDELSRVYNINGEKLKEIISLLDGSNDITVSYTHLAHSRFSLPYRLVNNSPLIS